MGDGGRMAGGGGGERRGGGGDRRGGGSNVCYRYILIFLVKAKLFYN